MQIKKSSYDQLPTPSLDVVVEKLIPLKNFISRRPLRVTFFGYFGMKNIGDDAILFAEITQLQKLKIPLTIF